MTGKLGIRTILFLACICFGITANVMAESDNVLTQAINLKPNLYEGLLIFRVCSKCHYQEGWGQRNGTFPQIAGQHPKVLIKQLTDVSNRDRETPGMDHFVMLKIIDTPQALANVAGYISQILMTPNPGIGPGTNLEHGERLYNEYCIGCHGENGEGDNDKFSPRVQGQHYEYLLRQFRWIYNRERLNATPGMVTAIADFSDQDAEAVIDYVSRLKPPQHLVAPSKKWRNPDFD